MDYLRNYPCKVGHEFTYHARPGGTSSVHLDHRMKFEIAPLPGRTSVTVYCLTCRRNANISTGNLVRDYTSGPVLPPADDWDQYAPRPALNVTEGEGMFQVTAVEVKEGYVGQVKFENKIVWESSPQPLGERDKDTGNFEGHINAYKLAEEAKAKAVAGLFADV